MNPAFHDLFARTWTAAGRSIDAAGDVPGEVAVTGPRTVLPSVFDVTGLATSAVATATLAAAQLHAVRGSSPMPAVAVDSVEACASFRAEALFEPVGWRLPPPWDSLSGDYRAADGWVRLHTNYAHHRAAVQEVLGASDRAAARAAVAARAAEEVESAVIASGGAAAAMRTRDEWAASPPGRAAADIPAVAIDEHDGAIPSRWAGADPASPFSGVRVLDLTRVLAGPVCTKFLAAYGADVLRIDPPGFDEVPALLPETTLGKRTAALDLTAPDDRRVFETLVAGSDVIVIGYRADAMERLGYGDDALRALSPGIVIARLDAYGWAGPWRNRRGFDSLVQMSCGIAAAGALAHHRDEPTPLPAQALDHATGWLLAGAIARTLTRQLVRPRASSLRGSLIGTANLLCDLGASDDVPAVVERAPVGLERVSTVWGAARRAPFPGSIEGVRPHWRHRAGPLGRHHARVPSRR